jgi:hypothetical protein
MEFYNNNVNDKLNFKINIEGIDINKIEPRLIITNEKNNYIFFGKIKENVCTFDIPELSAYTKSDKGKVKFEIISEDLYFPVWKDEFEIKTKVSVKIEELYHEILEQPKPKVIVGAILEKTEPKKEEPIKESKKVSEKTQNTIDKILKEEEEKEKKLISEMAKFEEENIEEESKEIKVPKIKRFGEE